MPLRDHFRPPAEEGEWSPVHSAWAVALMGWLNHTLPADEYRARAHIHLGTQVEADVAEFERAGADRGSRNGAVATLPTVTAPVATVVAVFPDEFEVQVKDRIGNLVLAGVIELVSPANKKETRERRSFVGKCAAYLDQGVGLVIVDVVTDRLANFHNELMAALGGTHAFPKGVPTYVAGYKPVRREGRNEIDVWAEPAVVGQPVPSVPLALRRGPLVPLDLEATYAQALALAGL